MKKLATIITIVTLIASGNISIINASAKDLEKNKDNVQLESNNKSNEKTTYPMDETPITDPYTLEYKEKMEILNEEYKNSSVIKQMQLQKHMDKLHKEYVENIGPIKDTKFIEPETIDQGDYPVNDDPKFPNWELYGDVVVTRTFSSSSLYIGHALIVDIDQEWYVESCKKGLCASAYQDGVQYRQGLSNNVTNHNRNNWGRYHVRNAQKSHYLNSLGYAQAKVGQPYNSSFMESGSGFYCSELVAFAWRDSGHNIIGSSNYNMITPMQIANSYNTYRVDGNL